MASQYKSIRCPGCDGTLEYNAAKKVWICKYCGNEVRREEEYDGLYTIKNVARQVLVDVAYGRLDSAQKNLIECQKISASYVGTIIGELCLKVFTLMTPGACPDTEVKSMYGQVKRLYQQLQEIDPAISSEEEALYESFDGNGDAFGVLLLGFDMLGAKAHADFVRNFLDPARVYSVNLNGRLLKYAIKNGQTDLVNGIFANPDNLNCRTALFTLLKSYADGETKRGYISSLFAQAKLESADHKRFSEYLRTTSDSVSTRAMVYRLAVESGCTPSVRVVMDTILGEQGITAEETEAVLTTFCETKPKDAELDELLEDIFLRHGGTQAISEMQTLMGTGIYIRPQDKLLRSMVLRTDWSAEERAIMISLVEQGNLDFRTNDGILGEILLRDAEPTDKRLVLIREMKKHLDTVSTGVMRDYILQVTLDGDYKPEVLAELLQLDLNMSFFRDLMNQYASQSPDTPEVTQRVMQMFSAQGLTVDSGVLLDMALKSTPETEMETIAYLQKSVDGGTRMGNRDLSVYLEKVRPDYFSSGLIALLHTPNSLISDLALAKYVLFSEDDFEIKMANSLVFAEQNGKPFGTSSVAIRFLDQNLTCNLLQAYVMVSEDSAVLMDSMADAMIRQGAKLNPAVSVDGQVVKFKKYATDHKEDFSPATLEILEKQKVFSFFF